MLKLFFLVKYISEKDRKEQTFRRIAIKLYTSVSDYEGVGMNIVELSYRSKHGLYYIAYV